MENLSVVDNPRSVSRGSKLQGGFLGIDSLYLVLEYPHLDVFEFWSSFVSDFHDRRLRSGLSFDDYVLRTGAHGYKLSVWDGDARLFITDRVEGTLEGTASAGQGMGVMLQLGPKWLRQFCDGRPPEKLIQNVLAQFTMFGVLNPEKYPIRLNRVDITLDVLGLRVADFLLDEWRTQWVGYARQKKFHDSALTGELEGLEIGSSSGAVRFKVYDKVAQSRKIGAFGFWCSVWGVDETDDLDVARFEWTIKVYQARFSGLRYLSDYSHEGLVELLNYVSLKWGRLCIPDPDDSNQSRWTLAPLWMEIRRLIEEWAVGSQATASREYHFDPDLKPMYLKSVTGWLGGFMARVGINNHLDNPSSLSEALDMLTAEGLSVHQNAREKWDVLSKLSGGDKSS